MVSCAGADPELNKREGVYFGVLMVIRLLSRSNFALEVVTVINSASGVSL